MNLKLTLLLFVITSTLFAQNNETVDLKWKIAKEEKLNYATIMSKIDTTAIDVDFGFLSKLSSSLSEKTINEGKTFLKKINEAYKNLDYTTSLSTNKKGIIDIIMTTHVNESIKDEDVSKSIQPLNNTVALRGSVYDTGAIHSFWMKNKQKNLLAMFFQLPTTSVKVGDRWTINVNFIENDQNFECNKSHKINNVTLTHIKEINGEKIAVLKYHIEEFVEGVFNMPSFKKNSSEQKELMFNFAYHGIAEFSIDQGRWISYDGIMSLNASGIMTANSKSKFSLIKE